MKVRPVFAWYDLWVGVFIDRAKRRAFDEDRPMAELVRDAVEKYLGPAAITKGPRPLEAPVPPKRRRDACSLPPGRRIGDTCAECGETVGRRA